MDKRPVTLDAVVNIMVNRSDEYHDAEPPLGGGQRRRYIEETNEELLKMIGEYYKYKKTNDVTERCSIDSAKNEVVAKLTNKNHDLSIVTGERTRDFIGAAVHNLEAVWDERKAELGKAASVAEMKR